MAQIYTANALFQINFIHSHIFLLPLWIAYKTEIKKQGVISSKHLKSKKKDQF
jgi:hypothetical protein